MTNIICYDGDELNVIYTNTNLTQSEKEFLDIFIDCYNKNSNFGLNITIFENLVLNQKIKMGDLNEYLYQLNDKRFNKKILKTIYDEKGERWFNCCEINDNLKNNNNNLVFKF
jgi:hypothetical protein